MKSRLNFLKSIMWLTQFGLSIAVPLVLCILGAVFLRNRFQLGGWILILGVFLGIFSAAAALYSSLKMMKFLFQNDSDDGSEPPISFNDHK